MKSISPFSLSSREGTADSGVRSDTVDSVRTRSGLEGWTRGGEEERIPVLDVGIGVGYLRKAVDPSGPSQACRFHGLGRPGEDEGSKGGSKEGAGRLTPCTRNAEETGGREGSPDPVPSVDLMGDEVILLLEYQEA
jgi:hypothetical protein